MDVIYELKNKRAGLIKEAEAAVKKGDMELYNAKIGEVGRLNAEIEAMEKLNAEKGRFNDDDHDMVNLHVVQQQGKEEAKKNRTLNTIRTGNEYANAWAQAMRNRAAIDTCQGIEAYRPLYDAMTIGGGTPEGSEGGFLVPIDFDNMIHLLRKEFVCLADLFNVENVSGLTGWRAVETSATAATLPEIDEANELPKDQKPKFKKVTYKARKFGDRLAISNELLNDNTANLMQYLANWFGRRLILTENTLLLELMKGIPSKILTPGSELSELKSTLNKDLNTAISKNAVILGNQSSYDILDQMTDKNGRGLLVPNPADPDVYRFKNRSVICADNDLIPSREVKSGENKGEYHPLYIGWFKMFGTLFRRQALEFATTNIGGEAWGTATNEVRGIVRMDAQRVDNTAAVIREVVESNETTTG